MATYNRGEIKTDTMALVNRATELYNRNERAKAYSRSVARKRRVRERKENTTLILVPFAIVGFLYIALQVSAHLCVWLGGMM